MNLKFTKLDQDRAKENQELSKEIVEFEKKNIKNINNIVTKNSSSNISRSLQVSIELTGGILVGAFMGYMIDKYFSTMPIFLITLLLLGFLGGMLNLYKMLKSE